MDWVYAESPNFFAMAGLGPIVEGYSLIASKHHVPGMIDVSYDYLDEYAAFSARVLALISDEYGAAYVTEHGRMGVCNEIEDGHTEGHCFHAHQLVFPNVKHIENRFLRLYPKVDIYRNRREAITHSVRGEYLYLESPTGLVYISRAYHPVHRQLFRQLVALDKDCPGQYDWARFPDKNRVDQYAKRLRKGWEASERARFKKVES